MSDHHSEIMQALGRIEQKIDGHVTEDRAVHARTDKDIDKLFSKTNAVEKTQVRHRGIGIGVVGVFSAILAVLKLDYWG